MNVFAYVVNGLRRALELERELGTRQVEIDRTLLKAAANDRQTVAVKSKGNASNVVVTQNDVRASSPLPPKGVLPAKSDAKRIGVTPGAARFVFLHDRPLSPMGVEMVHKIAENVLHIAPESAPIITELPLPNAQDYIVLGSRATKKFFSTFKAEPGICREMQGGSFVLITYSPDLILLMKDENRIKVSKWQMMQHLKILLQNRKKWGEGR